MSNVRGEKWFKSVIHYWHSKHSRAKFVKCWLQAILGSTFDISHQNLLKCVCIYMYVYGHKTNYSLKSLCPDTMIQLGIFYCILFYFFWFTKEKKILMTTLNWIHSPIISLTFSLKDTILEEIVIIYSYDLNHPS